MNLIERKTDLTQIRSLMRIFPVVAILGKRQCGKTTIVKSFEFDHYFDLESPRDLAALDQPQLALEALEGLIVIDEIQRKPNLFPSSISIARWSKWVNAVMKTPLKASHA